MKIRSVKIDGYGRFSERALEFAPGLQVIVGPNEQGKSTLRSFIGDMLYGQKRSTTQRLYELSNKLRAPWGGADTYGGHLVYVLDSGREIEVSRVFDKADESIQVFDLTNACEITNDFERLRNREPVFARTHLGISKDVFLNAATLNHVSLEDLGNAGALDHIREKLLSLADSGQEHTSADGAIKSLQARIAVIGPPNARTRPLPAARAQRDELDREREAARELRRELADIEQRRQEVLRDVAESRGHLARLETDLETLRRADRAQRLAKAEELTARLGEVTPRCEELSHTEGFPLGQRDEFQRAETQCSAARDQLDRLHSEREQRRESVASELEALGESLASGESDISEDCDRELTTIAETVRALNIRHEESLTALDAAKNRLATAETELAQLPDFSRLPREPGSLMTQLASSFHVARDARDQEQAKLEQMTARLSEQRAAIADPEALFADCPNFDAIARDYEVKIRLRDKEIDDLEAALEGLQTRATEHSARVPGFAVLSAFAAALLIALLAVALAREISGIYIPGVLTGFAFLYFLAKMLIERTNTAKAQMELEQAETKIVQLRSTEDQECLRVEAMIVRAHCQTVRELEALFDGYRKDRLELDTLEQAQQDQQAKAQAAQRHVAGLLESYRERFCDVGEDLRSEADVDGAARRAAARYQSYRDAKRRVAENRELIERHESDASGVESELVEQREREVELGLEVRKKMRDNGYADEKRQDNVLTALRSYRIRSAQLREKRRGLEERLADADHRVQEAQAEFQTRQTELGVYLEAANVPTAEAWHDHAAQAEQYLDLRRQVDALDEQLASVLGQYSLDELRAPRESDDPVGEPPQASEEELKHSYEAVAAHTDALMKEEHGLHLTLTERAAGARSINEIDEELAAATRRVQALEMEMEAASHALALVEEIATDKHARIAPRLAEGASAYIKEITGGLYDELMVSRDLVVSVRIPATNRLSDKPGSVLSKGTVDQIYLALRLAMVQSISEQGESIPMLLDDPFANYDDQRLERALALLTRIAQDNQVLLFTCRDDVVRAAQVSKAPTLML